MGAAAGRHTDIHLSISRNDGGGLVVRADRVPTGRVGQPRRSFHWFNNLRTRDLPRAGSSRDQLEKFTRFDVGFGDGLAKVDFLPFVMPSLARMHARSSARQLWRNMSAAATAPGYWRTRRSLRDLPSNPSNRSSM